MERRQRAGVCGANDANPFTDVRQPRVLLIDGDIALAQHLELAFRRRGHTLRRTLSWATALATVAAGQADVALIDVALPGLDGIALCREIRQRYGVPVIVFTRLAHERLKVRALDCGADDYIVKPAGIEELLARIRAILRRVVPSAPPEQITVGPLAILPSEHRVLRHGKDVRLTPTEFALVALLARNAGKTITHTALLQRVWGKQYRDEHEYLWAYMRRLRQKLEDDPQRPSYLISDTGVGYRLSAPELQPVDRPA